MTFQNLRGSGFSQDRGILETTSPFDSATALLCKWSIDTFLSLSVSQVIQHFCFHLKVPFEINFTEFRNYRPLNVSGYQWDPERAPIWVKPRRLSRQGCLYNARLCRYVSWRTNYYRKKSQTWHVSRVHCGSLIQLVAMEVNIFAKVTNVMKRASFGGLIRMSLVSAKDRF